MIEYLHLHDASLLYMIVHQFIFRERRQLIINVKKSLDLESKICKLVFIFLSFSTTHLSCVICLIICILYTSYRYVGWIWKFFQPDGYFTCLQGDSRNQVGFRKQARIIARSWCDSILFYSDEYFSSSFKGGPIALWAKKEINKCFPFLQHPFYLMPLEDVFAVTLVFFLHSYVIWGI